MKTFTRRHILKALCLLPAAQVIANAAEINYSNQALARMTLDEKVGMLLMVPLKEAT